jgi:hypothetical protein
MFAVPPSGPPWRGIRLGISRAALNTSRPIRRTVVAVSSRRTRVSITGTARATASSRASASTSASGTWPELSFGASTASGSPCTLFMACEKSASAASLIRWMA